MRKPIQNTTIQKQDDKWNIKPEHKDMPIDWIVAWVYVTKQVMLAQKALKHSQETHIYVPSTSNFKLRSVGIAESLRVRGH